MLNLLGGKEDKVFCNGSPDIPEKTPTQTGFILHNRSLSWKYVLATKADNLEPDHSVRRWSLLEPSQLGFSIFKDVPTGSKGADEISQNGLNSCIFHVLEHIFSLDISFSWGKWILLVVFPQFCMREIKFCDFLFSFLAHTDPSEKGSTLKGKNLLPLGANSFLLE